MKNVILVDHPLVQHKLSLLRRADTKTAEFRRLVRELSLFYHLDTLDTVF